jgi:hypothetical protein
VNVSVIVPWQPGCPHREAAWGHLRPLWEAVGEVIEGHCTGRWVKADAVTDGLSRASGGILVIADADVWVDPSEALASCDTWAVPHMMVHRLSESSTERVLAGEDWRGLPLDPSNSQDRKPYRGQIGGGVTVIRREVLEDIPMDPRFVGWGQEDAAWAHALTCLAGTPWRGTHDLVHLWHPPQPRRSRNVGNEAGRELYGRYQKARRNPALMQTLIEESSNGR